MVFLLLSFPASPFAVFPFCGILLAKPLQQFSPGVVLGGSEAPFVVVLVRVKKKGLFLSWVAGEGLAAKASPPLV